MHALGQVATFAIQSPIPAENLVIALNDVLPASIRVLEAAEVPAEFHARKSARAKTYRYTMFRGSICPPFRARYVWHYPYPLDEAMMQQVAGCIVGNTISRHSPRLIRNEARQEQVSNIRTVFSIPAGTARRAN